jgi:LPS-assembly lipoprotein
MITRRNCFARLGGLAAPFAALALLPGCGFRPAYMPTASGEAGVAQREMAAVFVDTIPERSGQLLRQALQERFERTGPGVQRRYSLNVSYGIGGEGIAILPDTSVTRIRLTGNADWYLVAQDPAKTRLATGHARAIDGFNILNQQYFFSDLSNEAAQRRIAEVVADQIAIQVAAWFRGHPPAAG